MMRPGSSLAALAVLAVSLSATGFVSAQSLETITNTGSMGASAATALAEARAHFKAGALDKAFARSIALADEGDAQALHLVGRIHLQPSYANFDPHESARLIKLAAEKGHAPAQHDLAELMRRGLGLQRDALLAFRWHLNAAEQRYRMSELAIADMYARGEGVAANQQQARVWRTRARRAKRTEGTSKTTPKSVSTKVATSPPSPTRAQPKTPAQSQPKRTSQAKAKPRSPTSTTAQRGHHIQLGAYGTEAAAKRQRTLLSKQLKRISPNVRLNIVSADAQDGRGMLHRLRTQSMDLGNARFLCGKLKKLLPERGCFIVSGAP